MKNLVRAAQAFIVRSTFGEVQGNEIYHIGSYIVGINSRRYFIVYPPRVFILQARYYFFSWNKYQVFHYQYFLGKDGKNKLGNKGLFLHFCTNKLFCIVLNVYFYRRIALVGGIGDITKKQCTQRGTLLFNIFPIHIFLGGVVLIIILVF